MQTDTQRTSIVDVFSVCTCVCECMSVEREIVHVRVIVHVCERATYTCVYVCE